MFKQQLLQVNKSPYIVISLKRPETTFPDKIFGTKWNNPVKLDRKRKVWYLFLRIF